jgi:hypothetical protein
MLAVATVLQLGGVSRIVMVVAEAAIPAVAKELDSGCRRTGGDSSIGSQG